MHYLILTGMSGAGKTVAIRYLEDLGALCVDNLPPMMLVPFMEACQNARLHNPMIAIAADVRSGEFFDAKAVTKMIDEARLVTEAAIFADKTAIDEETVRLHSHIAQYRAILAGAGPVGRKLDFLTQELNREANTIGSKCQDVDITRLVVELKSEIEKLREQLQNLE